MKIYTKTGDAGTTGLYGGERRSKADLRIAAYGEVDELQAALGLVRAALKPADQVTEVLKQVQIDLFTLSAMLARTETKPSRKDPVLSIERVTWLETVIDGWEEQVPALKTFILPGGTPVGAHLHLARAICRRAERGVVLLAAHEPVTEDVLTYLNRLSDALFVAARFVNHKHGAPEEPWHATS